MSLSWKENPLPTLMRLAGPIAASTISYSLMTLADTLFIGRVGRSELAGVALGGLFAFVLVCFSFGLLRAANVLVAQAVGAGRREQVAPTLGAALITALALGVTTMALGQVAAVFIVDLAATEAAGRAAGVYLSIRILGAPLTLSYVALREVRYGLRDARSPMISTVVANLINIALCWLFVFVLEHGVAGAAVATLIANGAELGILIYVQRHQGFGLRLARRVNLRALWKMGTPTGLQFMLEVGSFAILALLISLLSEAEMAAHQIAIQVIHFSFLPAWAVGEAAAVLAGQAVGAGEDALVIRVGRLAAAVSIGYAAFCAVVFAVGAPLITAGFTADAGVAGVAIKLLYVAAVFQIFDAANVVARAVLRGTGDVRYTAVVGVVTAWVCTPPLTWLLGWQMGLGAYGGWLGLCLELIVSAVILQWRLERRGWAPAAAASRARLAATSATPANDIDAQANEGAPSVAAG